MASEYWMVVGESDGRRVYLTSDGGWCYERLCAHRYLQKSRAREDAGRRRLIHVRVHPRSERLYLCERVKELETQLDKAMQLAVSRRQATECLAAWEPVVQAAEKMRKCWDEKASPAKQQDAEIMVVYACRDMPDKYKEFRA